MQTQTKRVVGKNMFPTRVRGKNMFPTRVLEDAGKIPDLSIDKIIPV